MRLANPLLLFILINIFQRYWRIYKAARIFYAKDQNVITQYNLLQYACNFGLLRFIPLSGPYQGN